VSEEGPASGNGSSTGAGHSPEEIVIDFLLALAHDDLDAALDMVTDDLEYINVSLPTVHGRAALERIARPALRPGRMGFDVHFNYVATEGDVVITDRVDELSFRRFASCFWVYGRFTVRDGKIAVWRDSFDWFDVTIGNLRALLGLVVPSLNRRLPPD
jgi:limonene-1,2-epoxide hydrolase